MNTRAAVLIIIVALISALSLRLPVAAQEPIPTAEPLPTATSAPLPAPRPTVAVTAIPAPAPTDLDPAIAGPADGDLLLMRLAIGQAQVDYRARYGRYWQAAPTHAQPPAADAVIAPDPLAQVGDDPAWIDLGIGLPADLAISLRVDVYDGPRGQGYVLLAWVRDPRGGVWERAVNTGPESWRAYNWRPAP